jgi:hypothetical protein
MREDDNAREREERKCGTMRTTNRERESERMLRENNATERCGRMTMRRGTVVRENDARNDNATERQCKRTTMRGTRG